MRERCIEYAPRLKNGEFFSHETALALLGVPVPPFANRELHVSVHRPPHPPRIAGIRGHRLQRREPQLHPHAELAVESPARAWRQSAMTWGVEDLVIAADHLIHPRNALLTPADLRSEVQLMGDTRDKRLGRALALMRPGSESPGETRTRLTIGRAHLPEPELNWDLYDADGVHIARFDMAYVRRRVCVEYDGRVHADDVGQFERDADRWEAVRRNGWLMVRILRHHLNGPAPVAARLIEDALRERGWRPGAEV
ncbi:hypothetical protein [Microbacterium oryzae]|uniref:hypothetical protein n=1 Tax=Microbacterium oryzae TaxID=743009 RepID=UPI0025B034A5|nr:hypothetical protein [Microbacterium oryzae]